MNELHVTKRNGQIEVLYYDKIIQRLQQLWTNYMIIFKHQK